jgi:gluconolactonase
MVAKLEILASGYGLVEGPRADTKGSLYFSDVLLGGVYRRAPEGEIEIVVPKRRGVGGISLHAEGGLVLSGRNVCHVRDGETRVLFERNDIAGLNDLFADREGRVLVGSLRSDPFGTSGERTAGELWRIDAAGRATEIYGDVSLTNGIGLSPDGRTLYHSDTARAHIIASELSNKGEPEGRRIFAETEGGAPDGLAVDSEGRVWVALYGGGCVARFRRDGTPDGRIDVPANAVTSLCFGGADLRDLYITTADNTDAPELRGCVFRTRVDTPGLPAPLARI